MDTKEPDDPTRRDHEPTYADTKNQQAEFEELVEEHDDDFQAGVDAQLRGEKPAEPPGPPSSA
jgi:hypothetical protein